MRRNKYPDRQSQQQQHQYRSQVFADGVHQLALVHGDQNGHTKEDHGIGSQTRLPHITDERLEAHLVGNQTGTGRGKGRAYDDIDGNGQRSRNTGRQQLGHASPAVTGFRHGQNGHQRQAHGSDQEAKHRQGEVLTSHVTGQRRENDVTGAQVEGEGHKP